MTDQEIIVEKWDAPWCEKCHCFHWHLGENWFLTIATDNTKETGELK